jgi:hypothetical protein
MRTGYWDTLQSAWRWALIDEWESRERDAVTPASFRELKSFARTLAQIRAIPAYTQSL